MLGVSKSLQSCWKRTKPISWSCPLHHNNISSRSYTTSRSSLPLSWLRVASSSGQRVRPPPPPSHEPARAPRSSLAPPQLARYLTHRLGWGLRLGTAKNRLMLATASTSIWFGFIFVLIHLVWISPNCHQKQEQTEGFVWKNKAKITNKRKITIAFQIRGKNVIAPWTKL